jgi:stage II sporulation protein R
MNGYFSTIRALLRLKRMAGIIKMVSVSAVILAVISVTALSIYSGNIGSHLSDSLIRLHVVANSDSPEDQSLKRDVRDAVLAYMRKQLADSKDITHTKAVISEDLEKITAIAEDVVAGHGKNYKVKTSLGNYPFPTKSYGDISLPAGSYQALRLVIGNGEGANWWCVLFPPLCFVDVTHGTVPDSVKEDLKEVLTQEEYNILTSADEESDIPIKVKFKIVELFQDSKVKFTGAINKLFKTSPG